MTGFSFLCELTLYELLTARLFGEASVVILLHDCKNSILYFKSI